jgi:hypothetical protein
MTGGTCVYGGTVTEGLWVPVLVSGTGITGCEVEGVPLLFCELKGLAENVHCTCCGVRVSGNSPGTVLVCGLSLYILCSTDLCAVSRDLVTSSSSA